MAEILLIKKVWKPIVLKWRIPWDTVTYPIDGSHAKSYIWIWNFKIKSVGERILHDQAPVVRRLDNAIHSVWIAIQWLSVNKTNHAFRWIVIYLLDDVGHLSNRSGLENYERALVDLCSECICTANRNEIIFSVTEHSKWRTGHDEALNFDRPCYLNWVDWNL